MLQFIESAVQRNQHVVVFLHNGEIIKGKALDIHESILQIKAGEITYSIKLTDICDIFGVLKAEGI